MGAAWSGAPSDEQVATAMKDAPTALSVDEVRVLLTHFKRAQLTASGQLDAQAFNRVLVSFLRDQPRFERHLGALAEDESALALQVFDADHDGHISWQELLQGISVMCKGSADQKGDLMFQAFDVNRDGRITKKEMLKVALDAIAVAHKIRLAQYRQMQKQLTQAGNKLRESEFQEQEEGEMTRERSMMEQRLHDAFAADDNMDDELTPDEWKRHQVWKIFVAGDDTDDANNNGDEKTTTNADSTTAATTAAAEKK